MANMDCEVVEVEKITDIDYKGTIIDFPFQYNINQLPKEDFLECLIDMYNVGQVDNTNFNKEIITQDTIKTAEQRVFSHDLEKIYTTDLAENNNPNLDYNQIYNYSLRPNKGDLPLANVPLCVLKDNHMSFKLSDRMVVA